MCSVVCFSWQCWCRGSRLCGCVIGTLMGGGTVHCWSWQLVGKSCSAPAGSGTDASAPPSWRQEEKQTVGWVIRVFDYFGGSVDAALLENHHQEGERGTDDLASCFHFAIKWLTFRCWHWFCYFHSRKWGQRWECFHWCPCRRWLGVWWGGLSFWVCTGVELLLGFGQGVGGGGQLIHQLHIQNLHITDLLHNGTTKGKQHEMMMLTVPAEDSHHLLGFVHVDIVLDV